MFIVYVCSDLNSHRTLFASLNYIVKVLNKYAIKDISRQSLASTCHSFKFDDIICQTLALLNYFDFKKEYNR